MFPVLGNFSKMENEVREVFGPGDEPPDYLDDQDEEEMQAKARRRQESNKERRARKAYKKKGKCLSL